MTPRQYAECCGTGDPEPYMFPEWEKMLDEVCSLIKRGGLFPADMDCLLTMMALDDETEDVLDCLTAQGDELLISVLTHAGLRSIFPQARWQCAELLGRRSIPLLLWCSFQHIPDLLFFSAAVCAQAQQRNSTFLQNRVLLYIPLRLFASDFMEARSVHLNRQYRLLIHLIEQQKINMCQWIPGIFAFFLYQRLIVLYQRRKRNVYSTADGGIRLLRQHLLNHGIHEILGIVLRYSFMLLQICPALLGIALIEHKPLRPRGYIRSAAASRPGRQPRHQDPPPG